MAKEKSPRRRTSQVSASPETPGQSLSSEERRRRIEQAAYFRAQQRGFNGGDPVEDWLVAEREINRQWGCVQARENGGHRIGTKQWSLAAPRVHCCG